MIIFGRVQGVGYRYFACRVAQEKNLCGYVRNLPEGEVEVWVQGDEKAVNEITATLQEGPPWSHVTHIEARDSAPSPEWNRFSILR